jgi:hypothetical protein
VSAVAIWDFDRQMTAYRFVYSSHAQEAAVDKRGYLVRLGKGAALGTFIPQPIQQRVQWETIYVHGATGQGSARDFVLPCVTRALAVSKDLAKLQEAQGVKRGRGYFAAISFPYSKSKYLQVMKLLETKHFKLPIGEGVLEITLAATMVEMGKILNMDLIKEEEVKEEEEEEASKPLELRFEEGAQGRVAGELVEAALWDRHREASASAAREGRRRLEAALMRNRGDTNAHNEMPSCGCSTAENGSEFSLVQSWSRQRLGEPAAAPTFSEAWPNERRAVIGAARRTAWGAAAEWRGSAMRSDSRCWRQRLLEHLLGWGYDARGCGGGRCK